MLSLDSPVLLIAFIFITSFVVTLILTGLLLSLLRSHKIFDVPNHRSSHSIAIPRGGGIAVVSVFALGFWTINYRFEFINNLSLIIIVTLLLALLSWIDDISKSGIDFRWRLISQFIAASTAILLLPNNELVFQGLFPLEIDRGISIVALVWFINLFNFMDGIDGISASEMATIGFGIFILYFIAPLPEGWGFVGLVIIGVSLGFLYWNWHPASIFLGDVGSIPLGFLIGFLLIKLAAIGYLAPAILLSLYYSIDASWTLLSRALIKRKLFEPHRDHGYQKALDAGLDCSKVVTKIIAMNLTLVGLAVLALYLPWLMFSIGLMLTLLFVFYLKNGGRFRIKKQAE